MHNNSFTTGLKKAKIDKNALKINSKLCIIDPINFISYKCFRAKMTLTDPRRMTFIMFFSDHGWLDIAFVLHLYANTKELA